MLFKVTKTGIEELDCLGGMVTKLEKIFKFLKFFINQKSLLTWVKDAWSGLFDVAYVESNLLNPLLE